MPTWSRVTTCLPATPMTWTTRSALLSPRPTATQVLPAISEGG